MYMYLLSFDFFMLDYFVTMIDWTAQQKWLKDRKTVSHYMSAAEDGVELQLKKKTSDAPELMDEAARKAKAVG